MRDEQVQTLAVVRLGMTPDVGLLGSLREVAEVKVIGDAGDAADGPKPVDRGFSADCPCRRFSRPSGPLAC
jgi:hypothetical protein